jgi:DNA-binding MarR family transcriptional regulator
MVPEAMLEQPSDREAAIGDDGKLQLRLWLRLLTCANLIEGMIRTRLRTAFNTTLPRFDVLAELDAARRPATMGDLSARLMVTSGNVTSLVDSMEKDGLLGRQQNPEDGRSTLIAMTAEGRALFERMAPAHQSWIDGATSGLSRAEMVLLFELLGKLKASARMHDAG